MLLEECIRELLERNTILNGSLIQPRRSENMDKGSVPSYSISNM